MKQILIGRMADASTKDEFCFSLHCEECTKVWRSAPVPFSKAGVSPSTEGKRIITTHFMKRKSGVLWKKPQGKAKKFSIFAPSAGALYATNAF